MARVLTAIVSDLHVASTMEGFDLASRPEVRERLLPVLDDADQVVLLGDLVELRERPLLEALETARPLLQAIGERTAGKRVLITPGNHDHQLAEPWLERARLAGTPLGIESEWPVRPSDGIAGRIAEWMPDSELVVAYPGFRPRPDVYVTHGHYLDLHLTVPRLESIVVSLVGRATGRRRAACRAPDDYEAVVGPLYALLYGIAQGASAGTLARGGSLSRRVWERASDRDGRHRVSRLLLGRVTIPGAVAALNGLGLGPFRPDISGAELRRAGLRAIGTVTDSLGVSAEHVIFGHTHRPGPLPGDEPSDWSTPGGARLWNTGSWLWEPALMQSEGPSPYRPGTVLYLRDEGPPELTNALEGLGSAF
ncbi:MAG: metallophosphoesterase [Thermoleophilaceae bacterium]